MDITPTWLKGLAVSFAGTGYEPWVQLFQFLFVASVMLSLSAWVLTRPHVITAMQWVRSLVIQADNALRGATRYAPATEAHRARQAPYVWLVAYGLLGITETCGIVLSVYWLYRALHSGLWLGVVLSGLAIFWFTCRSRLDWAAVSWAWHSIATGEEFTWPQRPAS